MPSPWVRQSMVSISNLIAEMEARKIFLSPAGEALAYKAPPAALTEQDRQILRDRRQEILTFLKARAAAHRGPLKPAKGKPTPSFSQEVLWWQLKEHDEKTGKALPIYRQRSELRTFVTIKRTEVPAAKKAIRSLLASHNMLRTRFWARGGKLYLAYNDEKDFLIEHTRWREIATAPNSTQAIRTCIDEFSGRVPGRGNRWLIRAKILEVSEQNAVVIFVLHHMICDRGTLPMLAADFKKRLADSSLPAPSIQFNDYVLWERNWYMSEKGAVLLGYWRDWFVRQPTLHNPENSVALEWRAGSRAIHDFTIPQPAVNRIQALARQLSTSALLIYLTSFGMTAVQRLGQNPLPIRCQGDNRTRKELINVPGFMTSADPMEFRVVPGDSFANTVRATTIERLSAMQMRVPNLFQFPPHPLFPSVEDIDTRKYLPLNINYVSHDAVVAEHGALQKDKEPLSWPPQITAVAHQKLSRAAPINLRLMQMGGVVRGKIAFHESIFTPAHQSAFIDSFFAILGEQLNASFFQTGAQKKA
jgi:hypothetical protein